ncbi:TauD/TfdA family dioxygenase [Streptomyces aureocirculatus]|uniref:TauD/TfdA family dioxygenase n=1 Tax=Streptomyces aureocirculatus TaxID=67275 RepID=UPI0004CB358D|nr:TauD/TfdA family dioxygenase [Streptomyces aureocirculatus]
MRPAPIQPFARHLVDLSAPGAESAIADRLRSRGLVTVTGLTSRTAVLEFASRIMTVVPHPDSSADGLTTIGNTGRHAWRPGHAGFGAGELAAHTDRSSIPAPPRLMLLVCARPAATGGQSLLADGQAVYHDLLRHRREGLYALSRRHTAYFGAGDGHPGQVFTVHDNATVTLRLRLDGLVRFSPIVQPYLPQLRSAITRNQIGLPLAGGQGYLLDNHRWLHARTAFTGDRVCWRALGQARFPLPFGFTPAPAHPSSVREVRHPALP